MRHLLATSLCLVVIIATVRGYNLVREKRQSRVNINTCTFNPSNIDNKVRIVIDKIIKTK